MVDLGNIRSETDLLRALIAQEIRFGPCELRPVEGGANAALEVAWEGSRSRFAFVFRSKVGPKALQEAAAAALQASRRGGLLPLVIVPYLSEEGLRMLEGFGVNGLDLSGNGVLLDPPRLMMRQTGNPSRFRLSDQARNVYQGVTSIVARLFLIRPSFTSPKDVWTECHGRLGNPDVLTAATVSRALKQMTEDLFLVRVGSHRGEIRVTRPAELLDRLLRSYVAPVVKRRLRGKLMGSAPTWDRLRGAAAPRGVRIVATGRGSAMFHTAMSGPTMVQAYVTDLTAFEQLVAPTEAFPNVELHEIVDDRAYFDAREDGVARWSSPVQTYLELAEGGPRERDTATGLRAAILRALEKKP